MQLVELEIKRERWGENKGQFTGAMRFDNELGEVAIKLSPEKCEQLFKICADGIVETAKAAANELTISVIEHKAKIEDISAT